MKFTGGYSIRLFQPGDEGSLSALTQSAICQVGPRKYSREQVEAWAAQAPSPSRFVERADTGALILVALAHSLDPVAYALSEKDDEGGTHLDMLYCHPQHTRRKLADTLLLKAEEDARANGSARLYTEASELARSAFERAGYTMQRRRDFTIEHAQRRVAIHNYAMEKLLL
ncbi:MAG: GNAT family N-acetyltransferase [Pseudomonadota bacterium]